MSLWSTEQLRAFNQAKNLVTINPQSLDAFVVDCSSNVVSTYSFYGRLVRLIKPVYWLIGRSCPDKTQVLRDIAQNVEAISTKFLNEISDEPLKKSSQRMENMQKFGEIKEGFYASLESIYERLPVSEKISIEPEDELNILRIKAIADIDSVNRNQPTPTYALKKLACGDGLTPDEATKVKQWFDYFSTAEGKLITADTMIKAFEGSCRLYLTRLNKHLIPDLVFRAVDQQLLNLDSFSTHARAKDTSWKKSIEIKGNTYILKDPLVLDVFSKNNLIAHDAICEKQDPVLIITSNNELQLAAWYGACHHHNQILKSVSILEVDSRYRWVAIDQPKLFCKGIKQADEQVATAYYMGLLHLLTQCVDQAITSLPLPETLVLCNGEVRTLQPTRHVQGDFWFQDLAEWVYRAVDGDIERYAALICSFAKNNQYHFFSDLVKECFLGAKDTVNLSDIAKPWKVILDPKRKDIAVTTEHFLHCRMKEKSENVATFQVLEKNGLIFPFCREDAVMKWVNDHKPSDKKPSPIIQKKKWLPW